MKHAGVKAVVTLRLMVPRDLARVMRIEQQNQGKQWALQDFLSVLQSGHTVGQVAEVEGELVGFVIYSVPPVSAAAEEGKSNRRPHFLREPLDQQAGSIEIVLLNLAVDSEWRRRGVARALVAKLTKKLRHPDDRILATVPESNLPAQLLLRDAHFRAVRILHGYYGDEDGYVMERLAFDPLTGE